MIGIINIYKEKGYTSHDVVAKLRRLLHMKRIGHTGTLDPQAQGVLPVCLGKATKIVDLIVDYKKTYTATLSLGLVTTTQDQTGEVLERRPVQVTQEVIKDTILSFVGGYDQVPPMYSALKKDGKKLYEYAREGIDIKRPPRRIHIYDICKIHPIDQTRVSFQVTCSKGTYIRTLCHDIGEKLGTGGHMSALVRNKVGPFDQKQALPLDQVEKKIDNGQLEDILIPVDQLFKGYPKVYAKANMEKYLFNGNRLYKHNLEAFEAKEGKYLVYTDQGLFVGLYEGLRDQDGFYLKVKTLFRNEVAHQWS